ncbi:MAG: cadherin-like domain-containing protein, partial [Gammaproteobacteria bacterium]|nr:cadherin-like domain-containing protein [Gammaproteobacteria bacterium]
VTASSGALGSLSITSAGVWTYDVANADVQYLKDGETKTETFTVLATDGTSHTVTVTITGINDAAVIGGDNSGAVTEDAATPTLTDIGTLTITDADTGEASFQTTGITASSGALGSLSITSAGVWTYDVANADVQYLKAGETKTETFTVLATDGTSHTVTVTITGINDAAVIGGADSGTVTEDVSLSTGGSLTITDAETTEAVFVAQSSTTGSYGSFSIATSGGWSYSLNNDLAAVQALDAGDSLSESFSVSSGDGTSHTVSITILGTDGAVVFGSGTGVDSGSVTEDTVLSASGTLTSTNLDKGSLDLQPQSGTVGSYGSFSISAGGGWSYSLDNSLAAVQALGAGESLSDSFTVNAVDGSPHVVSVSILGVNDAPEAEAEVVAATEGGDIVSGRVSATDVEGDSLSYSLVGAAPTGLTFNGDGSYSFDPTGEVYNSLPEGETQDLVVSYQVNDGNGGQTTATLTITITGTNDAPQVAGLPGQSTRENEPLSIVLDEGLFSDVDNGDVLTVSATLGNGDPLPDWLSFDPGSRTFNGTPPVGEAGDFTIVVTVTDSLGASDQASFGLTVDAAPLVVDNQPTTPPLTPPLTINTPSSDNGGPTNQPGVSIPDTPTTVQPTGDTFIPLENGVEVNGEIPDTAITADEGDSTIEAGQNFVVEGEGGGQLTFDARLVSGDPLPEGVRIDSETGQIFVSGGADISELQIIVEARDESGDSAQASFTLTKEQSSDQQIAAQLAATAAGGLAPAEAGTGDVGTSGQETAAVAADANNGDNNQSDAPKPLQVDAGIPDQMVEVAETGTASFEVPVDAFVFAGESGNLTLEAKQANGDPLPDWVEFDPGTGRFEVDLSKAGDDVLDIEELEIRVIASDGAGNSAFAVFSVTVQQTEGEAEPEGDSAQEQAEPVAKGEVGKPQADKRAAIKVVQQQPVPAAADFAKLAAAAKPGLTTQLQAQGRQAESQALLDDLAALFTNVG